MNGIINTAPSIFSAFGINMPSPQLGLRPGDTDAAHAANYGGINLLGQKVPGESGAQEWIDAMAAYIYSKTPASPGKSYPGGAEGGKYPADYGYVQDPSKIDPRTGQYPLGELMGGTAQGYDEYMAQSKYNRQYVYDPLSPTSILNDLMLNPMASFSNYSLGGNLGGGIPGAAGLGVNALKILNGFGIGSDSGKPAPLSGLLEGNVLTGPLFGGTKIIDTLLDKIAPGLLADKSVKGFSAVGASTPVDWGKTDQLAKLGDQSEAINKEINAMQTDWKAGGVGLAGIYKDAVSQVAYLGKNNTEFTAANTNLTLGNGFLTSMGLHLDQFGNILSQNNQLIANADAVVNAGIVAQTAEYKQIQDQTAAFNAQANSMAQGYASTGSGSYDAGGGWYGPSGGTTDNYGNSYAPAPAAAYSAPGAAGPPRSGWTTVYDPGFKQWVNVPTGQHGGIATQATMGIWGEAGAEALLPLTQLQPMIDAAVISSVSNVTNKSQSQSYGTISGSGNIVNMAAQSATNTVNDVVNKMSGQSNISGSTKDIINTIEGRVNDKVKKILEEIFSSKTPSFGWNKPTNELSKTPVIVQINDPVLKEDLDEAKLAKLIRRVQLLSGGSY